MNVDDRVREAARALRRASLVADRAASLDRFERFRDRRRRNQRVATLITVVGVTAVTLAVALSLLRTGETVPATTLPSGTILYGEWSQRLQQARWYTIGTDGSDVTDLGLVATCAEWFPDGNRIFITNDAAVAAEGAPSGRPSSSQTARVSGD